MSRILTPRDVVLLRQRGTVLVTAVDSCGGIGSLPGDVLRADSETAGLFTARVALMEVLAVGAQPLFYSLAAASPPETAEGLLRGARQALGDLPFVMSSEKNMAVSVTALGVTVTGQCVCENLRTGGARRGDALYLAGLPLVGPEVLAPDAPLLLPGHIADLLCDPRVHAVIPVGSRGAAWEARVLAAESGLSADLWKCEADLNRSGGPSTCAVFAAEEGKFSPGIPVCRIGEVA